MDQTAMEKKKLPSGLLLSFSWYLHINGSFWTQNSCAQPARYRCDGVCGRPPKTETFARSTVRNSMGSKRPLDDEYIDIDDTLDGAHDDDTGKASYSWEEEYKRSWDVLQEDEEGRLSSVVAQLQQQRKRRR